jgi:hypothetical protein
MIDMRYERGLSISICPGALYVDLQNSGADWSRPSQISQERAKKLLRDGANDYAGQSDRLRPDLLRAMGKAKLADTLEAWAGRPRLPEPEWPKNRAGQCESASIRNLCL